VPNNTQAGLAHSVRVTFNQPADVTTFTAASVLRLTGPDGPHAALGVVPVGPPYTQFDVLFAPLTGAGAYTLDLNYSITDLYGNYLENGLGRTFTLGGPRVTATSPTGPVSGSVDHVRVTFNVPMDPSTFRVAQVTAFTRTAGTMTTDLLSTVTAVTPVPRTNDTQFDVSFAAQTTAGSYSLTLDGAISDLSGNPLGAPYVATFSIVPGYSFGATTYTALALAGQPDSTAVTFTGPGDGAGTQYADDNYGVIPLGTGNTFNFYGQTYTQVFVSSNALMTFVSGNTQYINSNLSPGGTTPAQAAIAPLWSDWIKTSADPGGAMIWYKVQNNQLIVEWNGIRHYPTSNQITFQAILSLNTTGPGDIVFNYVNLNTGTADADGMTSTVGLKDAGTTGYPFSLVSYNSANPLVGGMKAIRLHNP
jgi:hypothetical protein